MTSSRKPERWETALRAARVALGTLACIGGAWLVLAEPSHVAAGVVILLLGCGVVLMAILGHRSSPENSR